CAESWHKSNGTARLDDKSAGGGNLSSASCLPTHESMLYRSLFNFPAKLPKAVPAWANFL
ncbi:MAG: hypothetical protein PHZ14_11265, partial [Sulfuricella sp.]|nr:hypothetical protein [Sulfuricella sp.]